MLTQKGRHLTRLMGSDTPLSQVGPAEVDRFITARLTEKASRSTIYKELVTLRGALRLARRRGEYARSVEEVMPLDFSVTYRPKTRVLSLDEIKRVGAKLPVARAAVFYFLLATGATYPSEVTKLRKSDIDTSKWLVLLRGTKRETRHRRVPIVAYARDWLRAALPYVPFERWSNIRRDLHIACDAAQIPRFSPNDVRRTFGTLLRAHGVEPQLIAPAMGHADSRMVERVYGRLVPEQLASLLEQRISRPRAKKAKVG